MVNHGKMNADEGTNKLFRRLAEHKPIAILFLLILFSFGMKRAFFMGYTGEADDFYYAQTAADIVRGRGTDMVMGRIGLVYPVAWLFSFIGISSAAAVVFPALCSLATLIVIYAIAAELYDARVGIWACALYTIFPLDMIYGITLNPDMPAQLFMGLSFLLFIKGRALVQPLFFFWSGILLGTAYLIKETALVLGVVYVLVWAYDIRQRRSFAGIMPFMGGVALLLLAEYGIHAVYRGEWTFAKRWGQASAIQGALIRQVAYEREIARPIQYVRWMFISVYQMGFHFYLLLAGLAAWCVKGKIRQSRLLLLWLTVVFGFLQWGSSSLTAYTPVPKQPRYLLFVAMPAMLIAGKFLAALVEGNRRRMSAGICAGLCVSSLAFVNIYYVLKRSYLAPALQTSRLLQQLPAKRTYVSWEYFWPLSAERGFAADGHLVPFCPRGTTVPSPAAFAPPADSYVVNNQWRSGEESACYPALLDAPPAAWQVIARIDTVVPAADEFLFRAFYSVLSLPIVPEAVKSKISATVSHAAAKKKTIIYYVPLSPQEPG